MSRILRHDKTLDVLRPIDLKTNMWFQVDKEASLDVMRGLLAQLKASNEAIINEGMNIDEWQCDYDLEIVGRHKLRFVELQVDDARKPDDVRDHVQSIQRAIVEKTFDISNWNEFYADSKIKDDVLDLHGWFHNSGWGSDDTYCRFEYDTQYKTWINRGEEQNAINGFDDNGNVVILDFSEYFLPADKVPKIGAQWER